jgi:hypothetical protein
MVHVLLPDTGDPHFTIFDGQILCRVIYQGETTMSDSRDFTQLSATQTNDLANITVHFVQAQQVGINTADLAKKRDETVHAIEAAFGARMAAGGEHDLAEGEDRLIRKLFNDLIGICSELDRVFTDHAYYIEHRKRFDALVAKIDTLPTKVKVKDGMPSNAMCDNLIRYAGTTRKANMEASRMAFDRWLDAIKRRDLQGAQKPMREAPMFASREAQLSKMLKSDASRLVIDENSTVQQ